MNHIWDQADGPSPKSQLYRFHREEVFTGQRAQMNRWEDGHPQVPTLFCSPSPLAGVWRCPLCEMVFLSQHTHGHWAARQALWIWASETSVISPLQKEFMIREYIVPVVSEPHPGVVRKLYQDCWLEKTRTIKSHPSYSTNPYPLRGGRSHRHLRMRRQRLRGNNSHEVTQLVPRSLNSTTFPSPYT